MGRGLVQNFHTRCLYQKSNERAKRASEISDTSPTRAKIPYAPPAHEVISMFAFWHTSSLSNCSQVLFLSIPCETVYGEGIYLCEGSVAKHYDAFLV